MDFLKDMKAKLEELEREAQLMQQQHQQQQQQQQQQNLFQPKGKKRQQRPQQQQRRQQQPPQDNYPRGGGPQTQGQRRSQRPIDPSIRHDHRPPAQGELVQGETSLLDDLAGHLEEAFLLQEVLGPPRCVRGWDD